MSYKCSQCGTELAEGVKYCPECGTAQKSRKKAGAIPRTEAKPVRSGLSGTNILLGVLVVALIIVGFYGYRYVAPVKKTSPAPQQSAGNQPMQSPMFDHEHYQHLLESVGKNPEGFRENVDLGNFLFDNQRFSEALGYYDKALEINPQSPDILVDAGVCHFNLQQYRDARTYFEKALSVDTKHVNALYNLGVVSARLGEMTDMLEYWQTLIEVAPQTPQAQNARQMMEEVQRTNPQNN